MPDSISTMSPQQKEVYFGKIQELQNNNNQLWQWIEKRGAEGGSAPAAGSGTPPTESRHFVVHTNRNAGGGFIAPEGDYPTSGAQGYKRGSYVGRTMHMSASVSTLAIRNTANDSAAYARALVESATKLGNDFSVRLERVMCGDGSGTLGVVASKSGATITLKNPADARKFGVGDWLQAFNARTANATARVFDTSESFAYVTAINPTTGVLTINGMQSANSDLAAGDVLSLVYPNVSTVSDVSSGSSQFGKSRTATVRYEPQGIDSLVSDRDSPMESAATTYGGLFGIIAPADYSGNSNAGGVTQWASYVNRSSSTGRAYTDDLLQSLVDSCEINSGTKPKIIVTSYAGRNEFAKSKQAIRRTVNSMNISGETGGGFSENTESKRFLEFEDIPIVPSRFAPVDLDSSSQKTCSFIALNTDHIWVDEWHKPRFVDYDGLTWRLMSRSPYFEGIMEYQCEIVTDRRNAHAKAVDVLASDYV